MLVQPTGSQSSFYKMKTRRALFFYFLIIASKSAISQGLNVDVTKLIPSSNAAGVVFLVGSNTLQTDNMPYEESIDRAQFGLKYSSRLTPVIHFTIDAGYEVLSGFRMPDTNIIGTYTLGEFMAEMLVLAGTSFDSDIVDGAIYAGGKIGFPSLKDGQGLYKGPLINSDTLMHINNPIPITMASSMPLSYGLFFGGSLGFGSSSGVHPEVFIGGSYLYFPFTNVSYTLLGGKQPADKIPSNFITRSDKLGFEFGISLNLPVSSPLPTKSCCDWVKLYDINIDNKGLRNTSTKCMTAACLYVYSDGTFELKSIQVAAHSSVILSLLPTPAPNLHQRVSSITPIDEKPNDDPCP